MKRLQKLLIMFSSAISILLTTSACSSLSDKPAWGAYLMWLESDKSPDFPLTSLEYIGSTNDAHFFRVINHPLGIPTVDGVYHVSKNQIMVLREKRLNRSEPGHEVSFYKNVVLQGPKIIAKVKTIP